MNTSFGGAANVDINRRFQYPSLLSVHTPSVVSQTAVSPTVSLHRPTVDVQGSKLQAEDRTAAAAVVVTVRVRMRSVAASIDSLICWICQTEARNPAFNYIINHGTYV